MPSLNNNFTAPFRSTLSIFGSTGRLAFPTTDGASDTFSYDNGFISGTLSASVSSSVVVTGASGVAKEFTISYLASSNSRLYVYTGSGTSGSVLLYFTGNGSTVTQVFTSAPGETVTIACYSGSIGSTTIDITAVALPTLSAVSLQEGQIATYGSSTGTIQFARDGQGTFQLKQSSRVEADVQVFTANGTWTKPANVSAVRVFLIGGGGGGGSGTRQAAGLTRSGGGGGGAGAVTMCPILPASVFAATESVVVGLGGSGGAAITVNSTNGNIGSTGGTSTFSSSTKIIKASGGNPGTGGATTGSSGGTSPIGDLNVNVSTAAGGAGGLSSAAAGGGNGDNQGWLAGGGGSGGGITSANIFFAGASGGSAFGPTFMLSGTSFANYSTTAPTAGSPYTLNGLGGLGMWAETPRGGGGGGGGAGSLTSASGSGGVGGRYGGGGGGGAGSLNGYASGAGGQGHSGIVVVVSW